MIDIVGVLQAIASIRVRRPHDAPPAADLVDRRSTPPAGMRPKYGSGSRQKHHSASDGREFPAFDGWKPARLNRIVMRIIAAKSAKGELKGISAL
jgi:hypothetical protein